MFSRAEAIARFEERLAAAAALKVDVDSVLQTYASVKHYLYQSRLKDRDSYFQKLETGRFDSTDVEDLFACTLVVPTLNDVEACRRDLPPAIDVVDERGPATRQKAPDSFRFDEWQLSCRLAPFPGGSSGSPREHPFELQIKTVTVHAWSQATHDVAYKGDQVDWRRLRLSAQLRALAEQADLLYAEFLKVAPQVPGSMWTPTEELAFVAGELESWIAAGRVPATHRPASPVRYAECLVDFCRALAIEARDLTAEVGEWLAANDFPVSLSPFQLAVGVAASRVPSIDWSSADKNYKLFLTSEVLDIFPRAGAAPVAIQVRMP